MLTELQAIDGERRLTRVGRDLADFPVDLRLARTLVEANRFSCLKEVSAFIYSIIFNIADERLNLGKFDSDI